VKQPYLKVHFKPPGKSQVLCGSTKTYPEWTEDPDAVTCKTCLGRLKRIHADPNTHRGKPRFRARRHLAELHSEEYAQLYAEKEAKERAIHPTE